MARIRGDCGGFGDEKEAFEPESDDFDPTPDEPDFDGDDIETQPCPNCDREIPEDTVRCPYCGDYVTPGGASAAGRRTWPFVAAAVIVVAIVVLWNI
jgi:hypothetical protein